NTQSIGQLNKQIVLDHLPDYKQSIACRSGLAPTIVGRWIDKLHAQGLIHIYKWRRIGPTAYPTAFYMKGEGKDKPCDLKPRTDQKRNRRYRKKQKQDFDRYDSYKAKQRLRHYDNKPIQIDAITAALFGKSND